MPGILASGKRLQELCLWKLQLNGRGRCLDLSRSKLSNFESYEAIDVGQKDGSPPKVAENLREFDSVDLVDLSHNFLQSVDPILRLVPNAFWINLAFNDIEYIPDEVCLPTVMGSLNVAHNETLPLDTLEALQNKYIIRFIVDLGVPRVRGRHGLPAENRKSEVYVKRIAALSLQCPNIWIVNDAYIPAIERTAAKEQKDEMMTDTIISSEVVPRGDVGGKKPNILLGLSSASDWCSRVTSPRESAFLSALQSFSSRHPLDMDCFSLDLALEDYLEEARVANEKGVCYQGLKGYRYPVVDCNKLLGLSREKRLDLTILLSSYITNGIPEGIFQEAMHAVVGLDTMTVGEVKDLCHLPEFAHTALICLLRRTIMKDYDDFFGEDDAAAMKHLRMVSVQPRYVYEFTHLKAAFSLLHGPSGQKGKGKGSKLPKLTRTHLSNKPAAMPSSKEVNLVNSLPDIVTSGHVSVRDSDLLAAAGAGARTIGSTAGSGSAGTGTGSVGGGGSWGELLALRTVELLEKSAEYRSQMDHPSSQTMAEATHMLDPLIRTAYQQQSLHQGSFQASSLEDGDLRSLSIVEEGAEDGTAFSGASAQGSHLGQARNAELLENSHMSSKKLVVSLVSDGDHMGIGALDIDAPTSLDLSIDSGGPASAPKQQQQMRQVPVGEDGDERFSAEIKDEPKGEGSLAGLELLPERERGLQGHSVEDGTRSFRSGAHPSRIAMPTTDVAVFTADRVSEPKFGLLPRQETIRSAKYSPEGVHMLHESPVFVQPYQLPKLEVDSVSLDRLGPVPEGWDSQEQDNTSLGSQTGESTPSVMSSATAARTMLAEMGTLRNVRNLMLVENRQAQGKVDSTTWRPGNTGAGAGAIKPGNGVDAPPDIRLSTTFSAYGSALGDGVAAGAGAGAGAGTSWMTGLAQQPLARDDQRTASLSEFLENSWKAKGKQEQEREEELRMSKELLKDTPKNLQTRVVTGVNDKLISLTSPIDNLKMATKYMNINMHTSHEEKDGGEVIYSEKTPEGRPLSATWFPVKSKKQYMVANSANQNPLQVVTQETAMWTQRQSSPTSRGGGFSVRPTSKSQLLRARSAGERRVNSKTVHGHNEEYWPLPKHERQSEFSRALDDTSDIVLAPTPSSQQLSDSQVSMKQKIQAGQFLRPSSRGPIAAATTSLHLNSGYKLKEAKDEEFPVRVLKATGAPVKMFKDR